MFNGSQIKPAIIGGDFFSHICFFASRWMISAVDNFRKFTSIAYIQNIEFIFNLFNPVELSIIAIDFIIIHCFERTISKLCISIKKKKEI